jgi:hypothetical protein
MVRRVLIAAFCLMVGTAPLADSLCYAGCTSSKASGSHHSCTHETVTTSAISAAPHSCRAGGQTVLRSIEARHIVGAATLPPSTHFEPWLPVVSLAFNQRSRATHFSAQLLTPLRI